MIRITCDMCGSVKRGKGWIIGYDLQYDTRRAVGRSLSFFDRWDNSRVLERGAVHFCSPECKEEYVDSNTVSVATKPRKVRARRTGVITAVSKLRKASAGTKKPTKVDARQKHKVAARKKRRRAA